MKLFVLKLSIQSVAVPISPYNGLIPLKDLLRSHLEHQLYPMAMTFKLPGLRP